MRFTRESMPATMTRGVVRFPESEEASTVGARADIDVREAEKSSRQNWKSGDRQPAGFYTLFLVIALGQLS